MAPGRPEAPLPAPDRLAAEIARAVELHRNGRLADAVALYRALLVQAPAGFELLHRYGIALYQSGRFDEAAAAIRQALALDSGAAAAHTNLGLVLRKLGRLDEALASYGEALVLMPDNVEALNNRGNVLIALARHADALADFDRALALKPGYAEAHNNRGTALTGLQRYDEALASYDRALALKPHYADALRNRGGELVRAHRYREALASFDRSLTLVPDDATAYGSRGDALMGLGRHAEALASYDRALAREPERADAHRHRGDALAALGRRDEAIAAWRQARAAGDDTGEIDYALAALGAEPAPAVAPRHYVASLFDQYADRFDAHLTGELHYRTPTVLRDAIAHAAPAGGLAIVDLGCGTGLVGSAVRPLARTLVGVDLSARMLDKARARGCYDDLVRADIVEFLSWYGGRFDVAVAADVFIYIGDLARVFDGVARVLEAGGLFVFSVEAADGDGYVLRPSRRYAHSTAYLQALAREADFAVVRIDEDAVRQESGSDVDGRYIVLRRR
ncbi:MAG: tetratricopeptide repeat protein [Betaproteobacteria bacterium]